MHVVTAIAEMKALARESRRRGKSLALVPTMGALHAGHLSLVRRAKKQCDVVAVSIFANPTQFDSPEDFKRYPRDLSQDVETLRPENIDWVFAPSAAEMYPDGFAASVNPGPLTQPLEGASRPGHFHAVATVVLKLFNIFHPDVACFGQKDFQQAVMVRRCVEDFNIDTRVALCPIVRDDDGLALSSRNRLLSAQERKTALALSRSLFRAQELVHHGETEAETVKAEMHHILRSEPGITIDYAAIVNPADFQPVSRITAGSTGLVAARVGSVRLIDNLIFGPHDASPELLLQLALTAAPVLPSNARLPGLETEALRQRVTACRECAAISSILLPPREFLAKYISRDYPDLNAVRIVVIGRDSPIKAANFLYQDPNSENAFTKGLFELVGVRDFAEFRHRFALTDSIRCHATGPRVPFKAMEYCSRHLADELKLFPNLETLIILGQDAYFAFHQYLLRRDPARIAPFDHLLSDRGWAEEKLRVPALGERTLRVFYCYHPTRGYTHSPSLSQMLT